MRPRILLVLLLGIAGAEAHRLPVQVYTTAQGMPRNTVVCLVPDPNGLLWMCTTEGLVRFDGSEFRTFDVSQGLPSSNVVDFLIARDGSYWVATNKGVCRMPPGAKAGAPCHLLAGSTVGEYNSNAMIETPDGTVWVVTDLALYRATAGYKKLDKVMDAPAAEAFNSLGRAPGGGFLLATSNGVYLWDRDKRRKLSPANLTACGFGAITYAGERDIFVLSTCGLHRLAGSLAQGDLRAEQVLLDTSQTVSATAAVRRRDGTLWLAAPSALLRAEERPDGRLVLAEQYHKEDGLPNQWVNRLAEDAQGNLWGGMEGMGIFRVTATGFHIYSESDGLGNARISSIFEDLRGNLCVTTSPEYTNAQISHLRVKNGDRFDYVNMRQGPTGRGWGWGWNQFGLQAHDGEWWFPSGEGLYRYAATRGVHDLNGQAPRQVYQRDENGELDGVFRVFEDSRGDVWFTLVSHNQLIQWERATGRFHRWSAAEGWPKDAIATVIHESAGGTLWIGTFTGLLRLRNGRVEEIADASKGDFSAVRDLRIDRAGRVWVATANHGLFRFDNPEAAHPEFRRYTVREGMSALSLRSVSEDNAGFIYVGTVRAVDRIDPRAPVEGGNIRHYTTADGLPDAEQNVAFRDRQGHLWFGTLHGLAEFDPSLDSPHPVPRVYIRRVRVRGEEIPLPLAGAGSLVLDLTADKNQLEIEYAAADLRATSPLRYQYRLEGLDADWSAPSTRSSVNYASLPPGKRSFAVRAVGAGGEIGASVATVTLTLAAPFWKRWWFLMLFATLACAIAYWLYNYRVQHLLAVERLRTRIATDLHDDIGSTLTQISLLSEVGQRDVSRNVLGEIAQISRDLVREMSDIVWAVSPRHDRFDALAHRMRGFAEDAMPDGELAFDIAGLPGDLSLPIEYRRPLFLVFKESVNNVARHSGATRLTVRLAVTGGVFRMLVEDNGSGFDPAVPASGEGLNSIQRRLKNLGGKAEWDTTPGRGTRFIVTLPLKK